MSIKKTNPISFICTPVCRDTKSLVKNKSQSNSNNKWLFPAISGNDKGMYVSGKEAAGKIKGLKYKYGLRPVVVRDLTLELKNGCIKYEAINQSEAKGIVYDKNGNKVGEARAKIENGEIKVELQDVLKYQASYEYKIDGIREYKINDKRWNKVKLDNQFIGAKGCCLTATSTAISKVKGKDITPKELDRRLDGCGGYSKDKKIFATNKIVWEKIEDVTSVKATRNDSLDFQDIDDNLLKDKPVIIAVDYKSKGKQFNKNDGITDHYITIVGKKVSGNKTYYYALDNVNWKTGDKFLLEKKNGMLYKKNYRPGYRGIKNGMYLQTTGSYVTFKYNKSKAEKKAVGGNIFQRQFELKKYDSTKDYVDTVAYDSETTLNTMMNQKNKETIRKISEKYDVDPALVAGIMASEMDFDHGRSDYLQDGVCRNVPIGTGVLFGVAGQAVEKKFRHGPGLGSVHNDSLKSAIEYLDNHKKELPKAAKASSQLDPSGYLGGTFAGSVGSAAIVAAQLTHMKIKAEKKAGKDGKLDAEDMAVIWAAYRSGPAGSGKGKWLSHNTLESLNNDKYPVQVRVGKNAYMAIPYFQYFIGQFDSGHSNRASVISPNGKALPFL